MSIQLPSQTTTPLSAAQFVQWQQLMSGLNMQQIAWVAGYMTALSAGGPAHPNTGGAESPADTTILVGSQTSIAAAGTEVIARV